ncbi:MAG: DUF4446 family protein [Vulcanibacillus sp.]
MGLDQVTQLILISLVILVIWNLTLSLKVFMTSRMIKKFTRGGRITDFEDVVKRYIDEGENLKINIENNSIQIKNILEKIGKLKGNVDVIRYNAFSKEGQDLSYSIAFLDEKSDGVVISSIYNRGESSTYAKPIINGNSSYKLSDEELIVLEKAMNKK